MQISLFFLLLMLNKGTDFELGNLLGIPIILLLIIHLCGIPFLTAKCFKVKSSHVIVSLMIGKNSSFIFNISGGNIEPAPLVKVKLKSDLLIFLY